MTLKINFDLIRYKMKQQGLTSDDMAKLLNTSVANFYCFTTKQSVPTFYEKLYAICKELDLSLEDVTKELDE